MTTEQTTALVLKDSAGTYYLLPQAGLERGRVPAEHTAELERLMTAATEADTDGADAQGYVAPVVGAIVVGVVAGVGFGSLIGSLIPLDGSLYSVLQDVIDEAEWPRR